MRENSLRTDGLSGARKGKFSYYAETCSTAHGRCAESEKSIHCTHHPPGWKKRWFISSGINCSESKIQRGAGVWRKKCRKMRTSTIRTFNTLTARRQSNKTDRLFFVGSFVPITARTSWQDARHFLEGFLKKISYKQRFDSVVFRRFSFFLIIADIWFSW